MKITNNVDIMLSRFKGLTVEKLKESIITMDEKIINLEAVKRML